jgi:hypothetical protein
MLRRADEKVLLLSDCLDSCLDGMTVLSYGMLSSPKRNEFTVLVTNHFYTWLETGKMVVRLSALCTGHPLPQEDS